MEQNRQTLSRRHFLKLASGVAMVSGSGYVLQQHLKSTDLTNATWHLNPGFRLKEISAVEVELYSNLGNGKKLQHRFQGLEADLLREIAAEQRVGQRLAAMAEKHQMSTEKCRKILNRCINDFAQARLVYTGEKMLVYKVEA